MWFLLERKEQHKLFETLRYRYIINNPELARKKHDRQQKKRTKQPTPISISQEVAPAKNDYNMTENEAVRALHVLGVTWRSLRNYCLRI